MDNKETTIQKIPKRILNSLMASLAAGVVPRSGAPYIAIGRSEEIKAFLSDLEAINEGGASMRFLIGRYGSGKSFLIQLIRGYALEKGFITADCDLSPERRLCGTNGTGIATYRELIRNLASKSSPDGNALRGILDSWLYTLTDKAKNELNLHDEGQVADFVRREIRKTLKSSEDFVGGFDFSNVLNEYFAAGRNDDEDKASAALKWLRGEYSSKTEARRVLGIDVSCIICDDNWYDFIKIWADLFAATGFRGFMVFIDECVNLYKIPNRISRENNYEKILSMFNDTLQGKASHLGIVLGGTPQFLEDKRRGLFSYDALRSRLCDSRFADNDLRNLIGPVIRLRRLSDDELLALMVRVTSLHSLCYKWMPPVSAADQADFLKKSLGRLGADSMITPREMLRDYITLLNILMQNPEKTFGELTEATDKTGTDNVPDSADVTGKNGKYDPDDIDF